jgi:hypothetical protein
LAEPCFVSSQAAYANALHRSHLFVIEIEFNECGEAHFGGCYSGSHVFEAEEERRIGFFKEVLEFVPIVISKERLVNQLLVG